MTYLTLCNQLVFHGSNEIPTDTMEYPELMCHKCSGVLGYIKKLLYNLHPLISFVEQDHSRGELVYVSVYSMF